MRALTLALLLGVSFIGDAHADSGMPPGENQTGATQASLTVSPAGSAPAGSQASVSWQGPNNEGDYITVVEKGADAAAYRDFGYTRAGNPLAITLPAEAGNYELRYVRARPQSVLATAPIEVTAVTAKLSAPAVAAAGAEVTVAWSGPNYTGDSLAIVEPAAPASTYRSAVSTRTGNPGHLLAPFDPGKYEVRYVMHNRTVLARAPITVTAAEATLSFPASAPAGSRIGISFVGPRGDGDFITVAAPGAPAMTFSNFFYVKNNAHTLLMPVEPGTYEVRYVLHSRRVLAAKPILVTAASATLEAPAGVAANTEFDVAWQGPNYEGDYITITRPTDEDSAYRSYAYARDASPAKLKAPEQTGNFEIRYVLAGKKVIARRAIQITAQ